jgi:GT2 family glycosyltransferase
MDRRAPSVCAAVLNWNGRAHLEQLLPSLNDAIENYPGKARAIILDNSSAPEPSEQLGDSCGGVDVIPSPSNDFLYSYNWLAPRIEEDVLVLLNSDLRASPGFLSPLCRHFGDPGVFAVSAKSLDWEGQRVTSAGYTPAFHHGWGYWAPFESKAVAYTAFAVGGFVAVDRKKFVEIGGFDRLYFPAYGEDCDLGYRAWARGWASLYEPESVVYHREGGSWDADDDPRRRFHMTRTQFLFNWRHFRSIPQRFARVLYLGLAQIRRTRANDTVWCNAFAAAKREWRERRGDAQEKSGLRVLQRVSRMCGRAYST